MKKFLLIIAFLPLSLWSQQQISGTFSPAEEFTYVFLYHATPSGPNYLDRAEIQPDGSFNIQMDSMAKPGIYKIVYALPVEENNFDFIYNGKEDVSFSFSLESGLEFIRSNENKLWTSYTNSMELINMTISNFYSKESKDEMAFNAIFKTLKDTQNVCEEASAGTLANVFIEANRPYVPESFEDITTYSNNLKRTYLANVDFNDPLLQSSDFLTDRVLAYMFGMSNSLNNEESQNDVDRLMNFMGEGNNLMKTILLEMIWSRFKEQNNETVANYITDKYLLKLANQTEYTELASALLAYKNNAIGKKAHNIDLTIITDGQKQTTTLYDLNIAEKYVVVFWSSTCGHCSEELPLLAKFLKSKSNLKVIAIGLEDEANNWQKEITKYPEFIHVLGLKKWENSLAINYGVESTPTYFLLNSDKIIESKPLNVVELIRTYNK